MPRKAPAKISRRYLLWAANAYLRRWFAPRAHLRRVLMRRVHKSVEHHDSDRQEAESVLDAVLDHLEGIGALDDSMYAHSKARSLLRRGVPRRAIHRQLALKGVGSVLIRQAIEALAEDGDPDLRAAAAYVRKRRLGPYRSDPSRRRELQDKDLAKMGRAGFSFGIAKHMLALEGPDEVEAIEGPR